MSIKKGVTILSIILVLIIVVVFGVGKKRQISFDRIDFYFAQEAGRDEHSIELIRCDSLSKSKTNYLLMFPDFKVDSGLGDSEFSSDSILEINLVMLKDDRERVRLNKQIRAPDKRFSFYVDDMYGIRSRFHSFADFIRRYNYIASGEGDFHFADVGKDAVCFKIVLPNSTVVNSRCLFEISFEFASKRKFSMRKSAAIIP